MSGTVIHTGQVVIDLTLTIGELPEPGGDIFADEAGMEPGGGFNVLFASRQMGATTVYAGGLGTGPFSQVAGRALRRIGVEHVGGIREGDLGYCIAMTDHNAERTFVSTRGAETRDPVDAFDHICPGPEDVIHLSGYCLAHSASTAALARLAERLGSCGTRAVFDVCPLVGDFSADVLSMMGTFHPIWSMNAREAVILARSLGCPVNDDPAELCGILSDRLGSVLVRAGADGSWYVDATRRIRTPSVPVTPVDTNGAGDAHSGVLCAALAQGAGLEQALTWANVAGALSTTRRGPATCPSREEILARSPLPPESPQSR